MSREISCCRCTANIREADAFIVAVHVNRLNGEPITAEIEVCQDCVLELECVVLLDDDDAFGPMNAGVRERIPT